VALAAEHPQQVAGVDLVDDRSVTAAPGSNQLQVGDESLRVAQVLLKRIDRAGGGVGEPAVDEARRRSVD
jgi:hypothetical protein